MLSDEFATSFIVLGSALPARVLLSHSLTLCAGLQAWSAVAVFLVSQNF